MAHFKNQVPILITGVGKRIGYALACHFLDKGQPVIGTFRTRYAELDALQEKGCILYHCDFYQKTQVKVLIFTIKQNHPELRAIIHNASDWLADKSKQGSEEIFFRMMQVHAAAPYQLNLALSENLNHRTREMTDIIHISDYVAQTGSSKHILYAASKAAIENMTLSFAAKLAPRTKVNCIAPALVKFQPDDGEEYKAKALSKSLVEKEGGIAEVLHSIDYLLQSKYITGRILHLDGGRHLK